MSEGAVIFEVFYEQLKGVVGFTTFGGSDEPRTQVTGTGSCDAPCGDALQ